MSPQTGSQPFGNSSGSQPLGTHTLLGLEDTLLGLSSQTILWVPTFGDSYPPWFGGMSPQTNFWVPTFGDSYPPWLGGYEWGLFLG
ncbi:hypothetical protein CEXT_620421 [Caerostris extrusa]|uniref:Uncharacterized protein n=1 Tax=Caerostris extrusa TaxID=172846 RepID=A0AAV4P1R0_CAEEX|nr:hypothetical protein CEXT_620421 [Caerostris extrusa]